MPLRLKTKLTLTMALLVLAVVALISVLYVTRLTREVIRQADTGARQVAQQIFLQSQAALAEAAAEGAAPASQSPDDLREYVRQALDENAGLTSLIEASVGYWRTIYEVTVADHRGRAVISSDPAQPGQELPRRPPLSDLAASSFLQQIRVLYGEPQVYEIALPFNLGNQPFGSVRVGLSTALLRNEIAPTLRAAGLLVAALVVVSTLLAALVSHFSLAPLAKISAQLDRISRGEVQAPVESEGELGLVSTKISQIGEQLRGVREIFSTLRENMDQVLAGLEDGLLLFTEDDRAVLVSPSVEKFLGQSAETLLGRNVEQVFPAGHPLRHALGIDAGGLRPVHAAQAQLSGGVTNVAASVHVIEEHGKRMGALVTLRDLDSLERLGSHLATSEQLSALGRVTAGVAHEVKNPLNSMRLWLENLKQSLPGAASSADGRTAQQAVTILDSEIDRLDRVVKTFLDFTRPVAPVVTQTDLGELLKETAAIARPEAERARVELTLELPNRALVIPADRQLLKQAVLNLVFNAIQAMSGEAGTSSVGRLLVSLAASEDSADIRVADTGPGIPAEHRARVFQLFFTTRKGGSGIGLATAFRIVQLHGGSIDFETESGRGTTFRIHMPLAAPVGGRVQSPAAVGAGER